MNLCIIIRSILEIRMQQSGHLNSTVQLTREYFLQLLKEKILDLDIDKAQYDIQPFIRDIAQISSWSKDYFLEFAEKIKFVEL